MRTLLIDADTFAYHAACANETRVDWDGDGDDAVAYDEKGAISELKDSLYNLRKRLNADAMIVALTDYDLPNFRKTIYPGYKAKRHEKPGLLGLLRAYLIENYDTFIRPTLEADDVVGILATNPRRVKGEKIVVSIDKDLQSVPCVLFNPNTDAKPRKISLQDADRFFFMQVLTGDPVDNYPGCPGIGPKKAEKALAGAFGATWENVVKVYEASGLTEEDALVQARCARILRHTDYDYKRKEPILWQP